MSAPLVLAPEEGARRNPAIAALGDPAHDIRVGLIVAALFFAAAIAIRRRRR